MGFIPASLLLWGALAMTPGCLVTSGIDFQVEENVPPVVLDKPGTDDNGRIGSIFWLDLGQPNWELLVDVFDPNVGQELFARWRVATEEEPNPPFTQQLVAISGTELRELKITITQGDITAGKCHRLQLVVSGKFRSQFDNPEDVDDIGRASWWLWEGPGEADLLPLEAAGLVTSCITSDLQGSVTDTP